jgi:hypothetical protein
MRMPRGARAGLKRDAGAHNTGWIGSFQKRIDAHSSCEIIGRSFIGRTRTIVFNFHVASLSGVKTFGSWFDHYTPVTTMSQMEPGHKKDLNMLMQSTGNPSAKLTSDK